MTQGSLKLLWSPMEMTVSGTGQGEDQWFSVSHVNFEKPVKHPGRDVEQAVLTSQQYLGWIQDIGSHQSIDGI